MKKLPLSLIFVCLLPVSAAFAQQHNDLIRIMDKDEIIRVLSDSKYFKKGDNFTICVFEHMEEEVFCYKAKYIKLTKIKVHNSNKYHYNVTVERINTKTTFDVSVDDIVSIN